MGVDWRDCNLRPVLFCFHENSLKFIVYRNYTNECVKVTNLSNLHAATLLKV